VRVYWVYGKWVSRLRAIESLARFMYISRGERNEGHYCLGVNGPQECKCGSLESLASREVSYEEHLALTPHFGGLL
jgi:hypothetical protein